MESPRSRLKEALSLAYTKVKDGIGIKVVWKNEGVGFGLILQNAVVLEILKYLGALVEPLKDTHVTVFALVGLKVVRAKVKGILVMTDRHGSQESNSQQEQQKGKGGFDCSSHDFNELDELNCTCWIMS
ncbi:tetratricopeptide repeat protein [Sesbania bispinosa]|nr:tetratricopeptide repeat protein [Sesbania bispinosa]